MSLLVAHRITLSTCHITCSMCHIPLIIVNIIDIINLYTRYKQKVKK